MITYVLSFCISWLLSSGAVQIYDILITGGLGREEELWQFRVAKQQGRTVAL
jgi:hypothetical protein